MAFFNLTHLGNQDPFRTASGRVTSSSRPPAQLWTEGWDENGKNGEEGDQGGGEGGEKMGRKHSAAVSADTVEKSSGRKPSPAQLAPSSGMQTAPKMCQDGPTSHTTQLYGLPRSASQPWHHGSHVRYSEMLRKHKRNPKGAPGGSLRRQALHKVTKVSSLCTGPTDLYQRQLTSSQGYGWWVGTGQPEKQPWAQSERRAHVNSEMTRCGKGEAPHI